MSDLAQGTTFANDYRVVRKIAQGGMGAVYEAEQLSTAKRRALKVMLPQLVADPQLRARFEQEAKIGARIASEHVVEVVGAGIDAATGMPWLAMELLEGETLDAAMRRRSSFTPAETAQIFEQLCHALGAAHDAQIVHRDLKPENVFMARSRRVGTAQDVKILDFGVAKIVSENSNKTTGALGTPMWLAPEQLQGRASPASDVWALGLIAFTMLAGFSYWRGADTASPSLADVLQEISMKPLDPPSLRAAQKGRSLPLGFDGWFARCVVRDPAARFPTAREAFSALVPILATGGYAQATMAAVSSPQFTMPSGVTGPQSQGYEQTMHASSRPAAMIATPAPGSMAALSMAPVSTPPKTSSGCSVALVVVLSISAGVVLLLALAVLFLFRH